MIELPWPVSVNRYYRSINGRSILSKVGREYKTAVGYLILPYVERYSLPMRGDLQVAVSYFPPTRRKYDCDNFLKSLFDSLEVKADAENGAFLNDNQIVDLHIVKCNVIGKPGKVIVRITEI